MITGSGLKDPKTAKPNPAQFVRAAAGLRAVEAALALV